MNSKGDIVPTSRIRPDFPVKDDLTHDLGDPNEEMLDHGLKVLDRHGHYL